MKKEDLIIRIIDFGYEYEIFREPLAVHEIEKLEYRLKEFEFV